MGRQVAKTESNQIERGTASSIDDNRYCLQGTAKSDEHGWVTPVFAMVYYSSY